VVFNTLRTDEWLSTGEIANLTGINNGAVAMALIRLYNTGCIDIRMQQNKATPHNFRGWGSHRLAKRKVLRAQAAGV
jgi:transcription initiation factor IIE alpha subunit